MRGGRFCGEAGAAREPGQTKPAGHGRNGADAFASAEKVQVGDACPLCPKGKVYPQKEPKTLVRVVGQAPLRATVYELDRLRCDACGQIFTAQEPEGMGAEKYDETAAAMVVQMKYGSGVPFHRIEALEKRLGVPLAASTQWEMAEEVADLIQPPRDELIRQAGARGGATQRRYEHADSEAGASAGR